MIIIIVLDLFLIKKIDIKCIINYIINNITMGTGYRNYCYNYKSEAQNRLPEEVIEKKMKLIKQFKKYLDNSRIVSIEELEENLGWRWKYDEKSGQLEHWLKQEHLDWLDAICDGDIPVLEYLYRRKYCVGFYKQINIDLAFKHKQPKSILFLKEIKYCGDIKEYIEDITDIDFFKELEKVGLFQEKLEYDFVLDVLKPVPSEFYRNKSRISYAETYELADPILKKFLKEERQGEIESSQKYNKMYDEYIKMKNT